MTGLDVLRADLDAQRHALHLPVGKLPAGAVVAEVTLRAQAGGLQARDELLGLLGHTGLVRRDGQHDDLDRRDVRRQHETAVVTVGHDQTADDARGHTPRGLVRIGLLVVLVGIGDVERAGKAVAEVVACAGLQRLAVMHHALDGVGVHRTGELLLIGLVAADDGHGQLLLTGVGIDLEHLQRLLARLFLRGVQGVSLLPEKLAAAQERARGLFPAHDAAPLVIQARQVAPAVHDVAPVLAEERLGRRAHTQALRQFLAAAHGDPRALGREALDVVLLLLQQALGDQHRHGHVLVTGRLELPVEHLLDVLPDGVAVGAQNEQALDVGIIHKLRLGAHVGEPLGEIHFHIGDLLDLFFFGHKRNSPLYAARDTRTAVIYNVLCNFYILCNRPPFVKRAQRSKHLLGDKNADEHGDHAVEHDTGGGVPLRPVVEQLSHAQQCKQPRTDPVRRVDGDGHDRRLDDHEREHRDLPCADAPHAAVAVDLAPGV